MRSLHNPEAGGTFFLLVKNSVRNIEVNVHRCECLGLNFMADGEYLLLELYFGKVKPDNISSWNVT